MKKIMRPGQFFSALFQRFAAPALICLFIAAVLIVDGQVAHISFESYQKVSNLLDRLLTTGWSALFWAVAGCCLRERYGWHWCVGWCAAAVGALLVLIWPDATLVYSGFMAAMLCLCFHGIMGKDQQAERLGQVCSSFFISLGISLVLFIALMIITSAIPALFIAGSSYYFTSTISYIVKSLCFIVAAPWLFFVLLPRADEEVSGRAGFRKSTAFLLLPLYLILLAVLLLYVLSILLRWEMPVGVMNGYALSALAMFAMFHLVLTGEENPISRFFLRWGGLFLIPILIVQQVGVWMRLDAYGFTPSRILGIVMTILFAAVVVCSLLRKRTSWFFLAAAALALVFIASPLNADTLSRWNQESRLRGALTRAGMLDESGRIIHNEDVPEEERDRIFSAIDYLDMIDAPEGSFTASIQAQLAEAGKATDSRQTSDAAKYTLLGFHRDNEWWSRKLEFTGSATASELDTRGFDHAAWLKITTLSTDKNNAVIPVKDGSVTDVPQMPSDCATFDLTMLQAITNDFWQENASPDSLNTALNAVPVTVRIEGEEIDLSALLLGAVPAGEGSMSNRSFTLAEDRVTLPSGKVLHIESITFSFYRDSSYVDSFRLNGWLLTPEAE